MPKSILQNSCVDLQFGFQYTAVVDFYDEANTKPGCVICAVISCVLLADSGRPGGISESQSDGHLMARQKAANNSMNSKQG